MKDFLEDSGFTERTVCERLGLKALHEVLARSSQQPAPKIQDRAGLLIGMFLLGNCVDQEVLREFLPAGVAISLGELGLLISEDPGSYYAPAALYPMGRLYIASDRWMKPDGSSAAPRADVVYPAATKNTRRFLGMLPSEPCERFLDLCSGSGIAAFAAASSYARQAWAADITERSTAFAEFNRMLNALDNAAVLQGDLFEPVLGLTFDRIVAHPPYIPASSTKWIFQDAGTEGEEITRRIVAGLPQYLAPGGKFYCLALGVDSKEEPFESRIRGWLGEHASDFDVLVVVIETHTPEQIASLPLLKGEIAHKEFTARQAAFLKAGVESFVYSYILLRRLESNDRIGFTARRQAGARAGSEEFAWALRWEAVAASPAAASLLLEAKPSPSRNVEVRVIHRLEAGALAPVEFTLQSDYPFRMESRVHPWTVALVEACDGVKTGRELHGLCLENGWIQPNVPADDFAGFLGSLISGGFLEVEGFTCPRRGNIPHNEG